MLRTGLTGVIGCGKSLAAHILCEDYGVPVIDMDAAGRTAVEQKEVLRQLRYAFGPAVFNDNGVLDRRALGGIVFADEAQRRKLNAIVHPAMLAIVEQRMRHAARISTNTPYLIVDAALIFELGFEKKLDCVVTVFAPLELCLYRTMTRDHLTRRQAQQRFAAQLPQEVKCKRADYVLDNSGTPEDLAARVAELHRWLLKRCLRSDEK